MASAQSETSSAVEANSAIETKRIKVALTDANLIIEYVSKSGLVIDQDDLSKLVQAKFIYEAGQWNSDNEFSFFSAFTRVANVIKPVTIASIRASKPTLSSQGKGKHIKGSSDRAVTHYRYLAVI